MSAQPIGILVYDGVTMIDVAGPADVFHHATRFDAEYELLVVSVDGMPVTASNGMVLNANRAAKDAGPLHTLLVPGAYGMIGRPFDTDVLSAVGVLSAQAQRVATVCTGSFLLASLGLLDGRRATTHWSHTELLARSFPAVIVERDALSVRDGKYTTSAGVSSGIDLALELVEEDCGSDVAQRVAQQMVVFFQRPGRLSQFSAPSRFAVGVDSPLRPLLEAIASDPADAYSVDDMARIVGVSPRTLTRLFHDRHGTTPSRYLESVRVEAAQALLQRGATVESAARLTGFGSGETLRRTFLNRLGQSPSAYRRSLVGR